MSTCGFGHPRDIRVNSLCLRGRVVLDSNRNIFANTIVAQNQCPKNLLTNKVDEKKAGHGVLLNRSLPVNRPGIARIELDNTNAGLPDAFKLGPGDSVVFNQSGDWVKSFETQGFGPQYALQEDAVTGNINAYTFPQKSEFLNECFDGLVDCGYVECNIHLVGFNSEAIGDDDKVQMNVQILKNESVVSQTWESYPIVDDNSVFDQSFLFTMNLHDIVKVEPGDILNVRVTNASSNQICGIWNHNADPLSPFDTGLSYVTFKTLTLETES